MKQAAPKSVVELFEQFQGSAALARILKVGPSTASEMKRRGAIPVRYWPSILASAEERGLGLRPEDLIAIHAEKRRGASQ